MKKLQSLIAVILTGVAVAVTYHVFENAVHGFIDFVWYDTFNTDESRWVVLPLAIVFSIIYFGIQHKLDLHAEKAPHPTLANYLKILSIGYLSLVAGAALGPEAILIPACVVLGSVIGVKLFRSGNAAAHIYAAAGLIALFTAFFDSFFVGILSLWLVLSQQKAKFAPTQLLVAIIASGASKLTLNLIEGKPYLDLPIYGWHLNIQTLLLCAVLVVAGFLLVQSMGWLTYSFEKILEMLRWHNWVIRGIVAGGILSIFYIIGGPLVEFTGNQSITPMLERAPALGLSGLAWIIIVKAAAISWSKAIGYRGGMIFPTIFVASVLVAIVQLYVTEFNFIYGIIAVIIGAFVANKRNHVLE